MYLPYQMLTRMKVNKESTTGYERTTQMDGFPAYEEWNKNSKRSEMTVLVGDRFIVHTEVNDGEEGAAKQVMDRIDLKGLAKETGKLTQSRRTLALHSASVRNPLRLSKS